MANDRPTALVYCKVSFGIGHWMRITSLLAELRHRCRVVLMVDGTLTDDMAAPEGVEIVALPDGEAAAWPAGGEATYGPSPPATRRERRRRFADVLHRVQPEVLLIEYFPFGRHQRLFELQHLVHEASKLEKRPLVLTSLRDIDQRSRDRQEVFDARACTLCNRYFDAVLVHADPKLASFEERFPAVDDLRVPVIHTGYVVPEETDCEALEREPLVLVSAGGGLGGEALLRVAVEAMRTTDLPIQFQMRVIAGTRQSEAVWRELEQRTAGLDQVTLLRWVPDLRRELRRARVSVSRCGYNTALDLLRTQTPALVVPFATRQEDEQTSRAQKLARMGALRVLAETEATPERFAAEVLRTASFRPAPVAIDMDGARRATDEIAALLAARA